MQRAVLVPALEGRDIIARAKTGTGKTLAFGIPIIKGLDDLDQAKGSIRYIIGDKVLIITYSYFYQCTRTFISEITFLHFVIV